jgi:hypothetical protein
MVWSSIISKLRIGTKNPNFRKIPEVNGKFISDNRNKSINWIVLNLSERMGSLGG